jgi:hypothetical protein
LHSFRLPSGTSAADLPGRDVLWRQKLAPECRQFASTVISRAHKSFP